MIQYVQSLPYHMHVVIGVIEVGIVIFFPFIMIGIALMGFLSVTSRKVLMVIAATALLFPCIATGVVFAIAVMDPVFASSGQLTPRRAMTVPCFSLVAGVAWWYLVIDKKASLVRSVERRKRRRDS